jgi:hypothetical protein
MRAIGIVHVSLCFVHYGLPLVQSSRNTGGRSYVLNIGEAVLEFLEEAVEE